MSFINFGPRTLRVGDIRLTSAANLFRDAKRGTTWYVDTNSGRDSNTGLSWSAPFLTMQEAFDHLTSFGDTIYFVGNVAEHLTSPLATAQNVTIVGATTRPRHADTHPGGGEKSGATWKSAGTNSPLLTLRNSGWRFENILFVAHASNYAVELQRNATETAAGEFDASHAEFRNCRFASGAGGFNVVVEDCIFQALTSACILGVGNIGVGQLQWVIRNNHFYGFTNGVKISGVGCRIQNNFFSKGGTPNTTFVLNTDNASGGSDNMVVDNYFQTATANFNTPDVVGDATDVWFNVSIDSFTAGLESGHEVGQPA